MKKYIITVFFITLIFYALCMEFRDLNSEKKYPNCKFINDYCNFSAADDDVHLVVRQSTDDVTIELLLDKLVDKFNLGRIVYWRFCLLISAFIVFIFYLYNFNKEIEPSSYLFLLILIWFITYWGLNHFNFHYIGSFEESAKNISESIKKKLSSSVVHKTYQDNNQ
jgi:hypothetical protein